MKQLNAILDSLGGSFQMEFGLGRMKSALKDLGNPHDTLKCFNVAGTNGKGSTSILISSILRQHGFRVATFLSPHLILPSERILLDLEPIAEAKLGRLANTYEALARRHKLTYFEFLTLLHLMYAQEQEADFVVLETGLGGRLDATNVVDPLASVVTSIGLDHERYLGDTKEKILKEKLGILRPERLLFTSERDPKLLDIIQKECDRLDTIYYYSREIRTQVLRTELESIDFDMNGYPFTLRTGDPNAVLSAELAFLFTRIVLPVISMESIQKGIANARLPGRLETVSTEPLVLCSTAHNPQAVHSLVEQWKHTQLEPWRILCLLAKGRDSQKLLSPLSKISGDINLCELNEHGEIKLEDGRTAEQYFSAITDNTLLVGSHFLVGAAFSYWNHSVRFHQPTRPASGSPSTRVLDAPSPAIVH